MVLRANSPNFPPRGSRLVTAPAIEPVTATELRTELRTDATALPDAEANGIIAQARNMIEEMTALALINQTWRLTLDQWPGYIEPWWDGVRQTSITELTGGRPRVITFPRYPLSSVTSVLTFDEAGASTSHTVATYFVVDTENRPGRLGLKAGQLWPTATQAINAIQIDYVAGFGATAAAVPPVLRAAVLGLSAYYYDHRGECDMRQAYAKSGAGDSASAYASRGV
jgi:hypothetical protein